MPDLSNMLSEDNLSSKVTKVAIPNPQMMPVVNLVPSVGSESSEAFHCGSDVPLTSGSVSAESSVFLLDPSQCSSFCRLVLLHHRVIICVQKWKIRVGLSVEKSKNTFAEATTQVIRVDHKKNFPQVFNYFQSTKKGSRSVPPIVTQLNVYLDEQGLLKVKSKFKKWGSNQFQDFPILLDRNNPLTRIIILDTHVQLAHSGCYSVLSELRKHFYIPKYFSSVKKSLKSCYHCKTLNARTIKTNQSSYREIRSEPSKIPFASVFIDHLGPITVEKNNQTEKFGCFV